MNEEIKFLALDLDVGQTSDHLECPQCHGGSSNERSLCITRTEQGLLYKCHRNSCTLKGFTGSRPSQPREEREDAGSKSRPFTHPTRLLTEEEREFFWRTYGLTRGTIKDFRFVPVQRRVMVPFYDYRGAAIGCNTRGYRELGEYDGPKSIIYFETNKHPLLDFQINWELFDGCAVLVEDGISARKIRQAGWNAIALNGTHLSDKDVTLLCNLNVARVLVWFDSDAVSTAKHIVTRKYGLVFSQAAYMNLPHPSPDPKERTEEAINTIIGDFFESQ